MDLPLEADIWSLGATLMHMLTGQPSYANMTTPQILMCLGPKLQAPELPPEGRVGPKLRELLGRCFLFDPQLRPALSDIVQVCMALLLLLLLSFLQPQGRCMS